MWVCRCAKIGCDRHGRLTERAWYADDGARCLEEARDGLSGNEIERAKLRAMAAGVRRDGCVGETSVCAGVAGRLIKI